MKGSWKDKLLICGVALAAAVTLSACDAESQTTESQEVISSQTESVVESSVEETGDSIVETEEADADPYASQTGDDSNADPYASQTGDDSDADPYASQTGDDSNADPYASQTGDDSNADPYASQTGDESNADPYASQTGDESNADPYASQTGDESNADPYASQTGDESNADPYANQTGDESNADPYANQTSDESNADPYADQTSDESNADPYADQTDDESTTRTYDFEYETFDDGVTKFGVIENPNGGPRISFSLESGIEILTEEVDGETLYFKDMNGNGELDVWEDWREDVEARAAALSEEMTIDQIAGLMLFSSHQRDQESGLNDDQKKFLDVDHLRNVLHAGPNDVEATVRWANEMQAFVETLGGENLPIIPVNFSSDPRSTAGNSASAYNAEGADISRWPSSLGIAATFDPDVMREFSLMSSAEYRAMGITTALGPQIELATEPRWLRIDGTFGEDLDLATDMAEAYANQSQSSYDDEGNDLGWGEDSINIMIKHFPGDGPGESGRESHTFEGKYGVYPGGNELEHYQLFIDSGLSLSGETDRVTSMMTSYSIQLDAEGNPLYGEDYVGTAYNEELINQLREEDGFDGVLVTDWGVTNHNAENPDRPSGAAFGFEDSTLEERHFAVIKTGMDMFGGNNNKEPVLAAYDMWEEAYENGEVDQTAEERFRDSGRRIVRNTLLVGAFEDPYLVLEESKETVASEDKVDAGYQAQLDSVVMLKNKDNVIAQTDLSDYKDKVVYIPATMQTPFPSFGPADPINQPTLDVEVAAQYFKEVITDTPITDEEGNITGYELPEDLSNVDIAIVGMTSPDNGNNFSNAGIDENNEYYPLSLQYRPYTADGEHVRETSIGGDILEDGTKENRSYVGKTSIISNEYDLDAVLNTVKLVEESGKDIPVIVAMKAKGPVIVSEFEDLVDAIVVGFHVDDSVYLDVILGDHEPNGLLPIQFPKDMDTVEAQLEDVPKDMDPYVDSEGNSYDFGFGLNYSGVIQDERTERYVD